MISYVNKLGNVKVGNSNPVRIMGILNTSPESFYKKSISITKQRIIDAVNKMEEEGADFIDVGGMSTAPYLSTTVS
jgi:dihydropteroate synthase